MCGIPPLNSPASSGNNPNENEERLRTSLDHLDDDGDSDASSTLSTIADEDFPAFFMERDGRLFHSHGQRLPYPLPVDTPEQLRQRDEHQVLRCFFGENFLGPVPQVLAPLDGRKKRVVDLGTGTGVWVLDMAAGFPHAKFMGCDIVPIATRHPPRNVQFEIQDLTEGLRWDNNSIDFVHARSICLAVKDYPAMLREVSRILRPGGLFLSCEWRYAVFLDDPPRDPQIFCPSSHRFFAAVAHALHARGLEPVASRVPEWLIHTGQFTQMVPQRFSLPIGDWPDDPPARVIGTAAAVILKRFADSISPMLRENGMGEGALNDLIAAFAHELDHSRGMFLIYETVHARKI
ncbi:hypothetical protein JAAARDRAFT_180238 [Jaapia argillacea MUCL 33604]|uniref:Methyltransferase domain-containing protein n=1 Tax=Jaapia argillacea MUCL 33604 TaxID=933084 RepID=A0A067PMK4_9AGAM|nr:hypothetical protein JAAARDRAFT_180238 [Jaapia argillacea MUCL 33604]